MARAQCIRCRCLVHTAGGPSHELARSTLYNLVHWPVRVGYAIEIPKTSDVRDVKTTEALICARCLPSLVHAALNDKAA
jgi:hypothetical protein